MAMQFLKNTESGLTIVDFKLQALSLFRQQEIKKLFVN